jgi:hypothetical protein
VQAAGQHCVVALVRPVHDKGAHGAELRLDRIGPGGVGRVEHSSTLARPAQRRIAGVLFADWLSKTTKKR